MTSVCVLALSVLSLLGIPAPAEADEAAHASASTPAVSTGHLKKNGDVARLAGVALHLSQDAQALQRAAVKRREKLYGRSDPQARSGRRRLRHIHHQVTYFRRVKRRSEGR